MQVKYIIRTEDVEGKRAITQAIVDSFLHSIKTTGYAITYGIGGWLGTTEASATIEIIAWHEDLPAIRRLALELKTQLKQEAVIVEWYDVNMEIVT